MQLQQLRCSFGGGRSFFIMMLEQELVKRAPELPWRIQTRWSADQPSKSDASMNIVNSDSGKGKVPFDL